MSYSEEAEKRRKRAREIGEKGRRTNRIWGKLKFKRERNTILAIHMIYIPETDHQRISYPQDIYYVLVEETN